MSAIDIYTSAPLGSVIRFSNGEPRPPDRFTRKVAAWERHNGSGRLIEVWPGRASPGNETPATFSLHMATYSSGGIPILVVRCVYMVTNPLDFDVVERPRAGMARVITGANGREELQHLAENEDAARAWLGEHHYHDARIAIVGDPDPVDRPLFRGRAA
ncbi:hypothetical protein [Sphingopyxis panaciterrae]